MRRYSNDLLQIQNTADGLRCHHGTGLDSGRIFTVSFYDYTVPLVLNLNPKLTCIS